MGIKVEEDFQDPYRLLEFHLGLLSIDDTYTLLPQLGNYVTTVLMARESHLPKPAGGPPSVPGARYQNMVVHKYCLSLLDLRRQ